MPPRNTAPSSSYDLNYRPSLWKGVGGSRPRAGGQPRIAQYVDVMIGNEEDFTACLGLEVEGADENLRDLDDRCFRKMIEQAVAEFPNFARRATTLRERPHRHRQRLGRDRLVRRRFSEATPRAELEILDRVGGGDSFASGFIYGLLESRTTRSKPWNTAPPTARWP